jgi:tetrapyrrole methylase family protein/MazG family protein
VTLPVVRVVGLGPAGAELVTRRSAELIERAAVVRLRTRVHPAAQGIDQPSYDHLYESAASFEELYDAIVTDLCALADEHGEVLYVVPGSPTVAERTVELLRERGDVTLVVEPAVSVIDLAARALGIDPMAVGLRVVDALASDGRLTGPGPLLVLQAYSSEVLAAVAEGLPPDAPVALLHHLGLADERVEWGRARELARAEGVDHLTSLYVGELRGVGPAMADLAALMTRLRAECPWDQEQTHATLTRHLLEEAYEALDALEAMAGADARGGAGAEQVAHVREELGDLLFQVVFHAELADEEGRFDLAGIADAEREKLISRHPHVFGDVEVTGSNEVASRWEDLKRAEKGRASVTEGIAAQLPALTLYTKLLRKAALVGPSPREGAAALEAARQALGEVELPERVAPDAAGAAEAPRAWGDTVVALLEAARSAGVDLEGVVRERARALRRAIRHEEGLEGEG